MRAQHTLLVAWIREDPTAMASPELLRWLLDQPDARLSIASYQTLRDCPAPEGGWLPELMGRVKSQALSAGSEWELRAAALQTAVS